MRVLGLGVPGVYVMRLCSKVCDGHSLSEIDFVSELWIKSVYAGGWGHHMRAADDQNGATSKSSCVRRVHVSKYVYICKKVHIYIYIYIHIYVYTHESLWPFGLVSRNLAS